MEFKEAMKIIRKNKDIGFMVSFEHVDGGMLLSDHFPDKHAGEKLIETEEEAWRLAKLFAKQTKGKIVNIYVTDKNFNPVKGYAERKILNI